MQAGAIHRLCWADFDCLLRSHRCSDPTCFECYRNGFGSDFDSAYSDSDSGSDSPNSDRCRRKVSGGCLSTNSYRLMISCPSKVDCFDSDPDCSDPG